MDSIASRYALALTKIAHESSQLRPYLDACNHLLMVIQQDANFIHFLGNDFHSNENKITLIRTIFKDDHWLLLGNFLIVLLKKHRTKYLETILIESIKQIENLLQEQHGIIYSVEPIKPSTLKQLTSAMADYLGTPLTLENQLDASLIGGFRIDIQGKVFDASLLSKITQLRQQLLKRG